MAGFAQVLKHIRERATSKVDQGKEFERLVKRFLEVDPLYKERFSKVQLWRDWAPGHGFDRADFGIDLVATEKEKKGKTDAYCAIQCKCYAKDVSISKGDIDSFIAAASNKAFTSMLLVDTGREWGPLASRTIEGLKTPCTVLRFQDLADRPIDWPNLRKEAPGALKYKATRYTLRPHQRAAYEDVLQGFKKMDQGKLIMACGTGKTFTALRIAEQQAGKGGRVLYLVPSISLFQQSMREWAEQKSMPHKYVGICSDTRAGKDDEDASMAELEYPVTTNSGQLLQALKANFPQGLLVVFCTYQSLPLVERTQKKGAPSFALVICDEAHRTTGIEQPGDKRSPFVLVHDNERIRAQKRLYMTATPRLYTEAAKSKASRLDIGVYSMDDQSTYGEEFHHLTFATAVDQDLLSDYKVIVLTIHEANCTVALQSYLEDVPEGQELKLPEAARIIGCWRALQSPEALQVPENPQGRAAQSGPLRRAIAFTNSIAASKKLARHWPNLVAEATSKLGEAEQRDAIRCEMQHVDGTTHALDRRARIDWLKETQGGSRATSNGESPEVCRILSNARCLSEGIDVPALDAVLFLGQRRSPVDIVQAVGRVMRKSKGKRYGYIILPVAIPPETDPVSILNNNRYFGGVWDVLRALRSHDERLNAEINQLDLNRKPTSRILLSNVDINSTPTPYPMEGFWDALPPESIYAKIVDKCGDRRYWETWAKDVAEIFSRLVKRIQGLLDAPGGAALQEKFQGFHKELKASINESISQGDAIDMLAQHIITAPVSGALFESYDFATSNPVARALEVLHQDFRASGLDAETEDLKDFYDNVALRARGLDNPEARQKVLLELYEYFFATAMKKDAERLGIVYTPTEVVDFILKSADAILRQEFGKKGLSDKKVHILDPFTGTGIFLARLLQSGLIRKNDLARKYREELHANELILLAYYIAAMHIEEAYNGLGEEEKTDSRPVASPEGSNRYQPFNGLVLTDTFNLGDRKMPQVWMPKNSKRAERQQSLPVRVIIGNPPWSAGQRSSADENPNVDYPALEIRVTETYAAESTATNKNSLYDSYKLAIRWASDRIEEKGIIAFVTNGSWIDGNADAGVRACLKKEFDRIYVVNLRGNARTSGERRRAEKDNVFGHGSRAPVAITLLVRHATKDKARTENRDARILYRDIGDYLTREDKLNLLRKWESVAGIPDWETLKPDSHHDWINQREESFQNFYPMGSQEAKAGSADDAIFGLYSLGYMTKRDAYLYNFSRRACGSNARAAIQAYTGALEAREEHLEYTVDQAARDHSAHIRWDSDLKRNLQQGKRVTYLAKRIWLTQYRPFVRQYGYVEYTLAARKHQQDRIFPTADTENRVICLTGKGATMPFSALLVDVMPDLEVISKCQCFPRYRYEKQDTAQRAWLKEPRSNQADNISNAALDRFRSHYADKAIDKDAIFDYVYGLLHSPAYQERFANDLAKGLPRLPMARDFHAFAQAGQELAALHLGYETCPEYPLELGFMGKGEPKDSHFQLGHRQMKFGDKEKTVLHINEHVHLEGIPQAAHEYQVNGRSPLGWFIDRYYIKQDKHSGIVNDPNGWFKNPQDIVPAIRRIVHVSVETVRIVQGLPAPFDE